jgi:hypothetical protein
MARKLYTVILSLGDSVGQGQELATSPRKALQQFFADFSAPELKAQGFWPLQRFRRWLRSETLRESTEHPGTWTCSYRYRGKWVYVTLVHTAHAQ